MRRHITLFLLLVFFSLAASAQNDSTKKFVPLDSLVKTAPALRDKAMADSLRKAFSPKKATFRSLVLPGWGQAYNKKYWKIPIVYGALGVAGGIFLYNRTNYKELRFAYSAKYKASLPKRVPGSSYPGPFQDSSDYGKIKPYLLPYSVNDLRTFRDAYRSDIDYSVLAFILLWGLQVADATVDAHLKTFDVNPDLSFRFKLGPSQFSGTTGVSLVLLFK